MNTLIVIGWIGFAECYLNVEREEAIRRYLEKEGKESLDGESVEEFTFDDHFGAYAIHGV